MAEQVTPGDNLLPSESTVLEALASVNSQWTQRELAHKTGYSIGLINTILKKLSKTGYIKVSNINRRRLQYLLTPQGFAATSKVACNYILRTFQDYQRLYHQLSDFFKQLHEQGHRDLHVCCDDAELQQLIHVVIKDSNFVGGIKFHPNSAAGVATVRLRGATVTPTGPILDLSMQPCDGGLS